MTSHPIITALDSYRAACEACFERNAARQLIKPARQLIQRITDTNADTRFAIAINVAELTGRYVTGLYTDSWVDALCDVEYDVHRLVNEVTNGEWEIDYDDVMPAYVMPTVYEPPAED